MLRKSMTEERRSEYRSISEIKDSLASLTDRLTEKIDDNHSTSMTAINKINVTVARVEVHQQGCQKEIDACNHYRNVNDKEKKTTQGKLVAVIEKQKGTNRMIAYIGVAIAGIASRVVYKLFDK